MNDGQQPTILIIYPSEFLCYEKFERKVSRILSQLHGFRLAYIYDPNEYIGKYNSDYNLNGYSLMRIPADDFENITHAIIFDDGKSYDDDIEALKKAGAKIRLIETPITRVVNRDKGYEYDEYIGRSSDWGNPYAIGFDGDREEVIRKFKYDFEREFLKFSKADVLKLRGKTLGCYCKPESCHGDVIAQYLNSLDDGK